jgi:hypothetical protein
VPAGRRELSVDRPASSARSAGSGSGSGSGTDVLVVSLGATSGWRTAAAELSSAIARAGARVQTVITGRPPSVRTFALTDLMQAVAAHRACRRAIATYQPTAIVYCSITAALLWPRPGAVWIDSIAAENRPGRHGIWQRPLERRRLAEASLVLMMSETSLAPLPGLRPDAVVVPVPVASSAGSGGPATGDGPPARRALARGGFAAGPRDLTALTYAADPDKRRLDLVLAAWARARRGDETLVVAGTDQGAGYPGVEVVGRLDPAAYRSLLRRTRVFVAAPRREEYGIAPLEALADGCVLVTTPSRGPYPALALARELDPRLVGDDLAGAIRTALDDPSAGYQERADRLLAPFRRQAIDEVIGERVLPRLLPGWGT